MKISEKLEAMVADLISDEKQKREEVEGVLSEIHKLTEAYFNPPEDPLLAAVGGTQPENPKAIVPVHTSEPRQDIESLDAQLQNAIKFNMRVQGDDKETAERKAKMMLNIDQ